ncbi:TSUP family transporter [Brevibacterium otitidis]|uniref:Probable membrane transporter protein n=1 Tax=Brevibacterium otitidis TaxID=53364 RepID=A0ABV5X0X5_9MICO|nr:sulfite exporter TauE/SafE family protein [Brevibacterium otitidis]
MPVIAFILLAVFVGALSQRVTGMGFALVSGPFLVLLLDPLSGVVLVNIVGFVSCVIVFSRTWRDVHWPTLKILAITSVIGTLPGAWMAATMPTAPLQTFIGTVVVCALLISVVIGRVGRQLPVNTGGIATSGFLAGVLNAAAGVGGPAFSTYAVLTRWEQRSFAATMQPLLAIASVMSIIAKVIFDPNVLPHLGIGQWLMVFAALAAGQIIGDLTAERIPVRVARIGMITIALAGGAATLVKGLAGL